GLRDTGAAHPRPGRRRDPPDTGRAYVQRGPAPRIDDRPRVPRRDAADPAAVRRRLPAVRAPALRPRGDAAPRALLPPLRRPRRDRALAAGRADDRSARDG